MLVVDDVRLGRIVRAVRRRRGWRQQDLAAAAGVSQPVVSRLERGHLASLTVATALRIMAALEIRAEWQVNWRGGAIDRLLDELHAALGTMLASELSAIGWRVLPEVTFMRLGERGSIDLLGMDATRQAAVSIELKSELISYEQTQRRLDAKARVAAAVIEERVGWRPRHLGVILVLDDTRSNRERVKRVEPLLRAALPAGPWLSGAGYATRQAQWAASGLCGPVVHGLLTADRVGPIGCDARPPARLALRGASLDLGATSSEGPGRTRAAVTSPSSTIPQRMWSAMASGRAVVPRRP